MWRKSARFCCAVSKHACKPVSPVNTSCSTRGFGFGKTLHHNLDLLANLGHIADMGLPVMAGLSRKGMIGAISGRKVERRQVASAAAALIAAQNGASLLRVHDVAETVDALAVLRAVRTAALR